MVSPLIGRFLVYFNSQSAICGLQSADCSLQMSYTADVSLHVRAVSVFGKKSDAVCGFLAYFCAVLRFSDPPYAPLQEADPSGVVGVNLGPMLSQMMNYRKRRIISYTTSALASSLMPS